MGVIAAAGGIVAAIAVAQSAGGSQQVFDFGGVVEGRATGSFGGPTALGIFVVMTVPLQIVFMLRGRSPWVRLGAGAATILSILALSLALTRSAYVALGVVAVWLIVAWRPARRLALVVAVLFCILVVTRFNPASSVVDTNVLLQRISSISTPQTHTAQTRLQLWQATPQMIEDNLPFGVGAKNYPLHAPQYGLIFPGGPVASGHAYLHAHDVVLTIGAELGVPGLIALAWIVVALAGALMRGLRLEEPSHSLAIGVTGAFLAIAVDGIFDYSFGTNAIFLTVMLLVACAARLAREASASETVPRHAIALPGREPAPAHPSPVRAVGP